MTAALVSEAHSMTTPYGGPTFFRGTVKDSKKAMLDTLQNLS
jgi:hypothetical protein